MDLIRDLLDNCTLISNHLIANDAARICPVGKRTPASNAGKIQIDLERFHRIVTTNVGASISRMDFNDLFKAEGMSIMRNREWRDYKIFALTLDTTPRKPVDADVIESSLRIALMAVLQSFQSRQQEQVGTSIMVASTSPSISSANQEAPLSESSDADHHHVAKRSRINNVDEDRRKKEASDFDRDRMEAEAEFAKFDQFVASQKWLAGDPPDDIGEDINHLYMDIDYC